MTGLILCGGQSARMGSDKGLLKMAGSTWAAHAVATLEKTGLPVFLSVNAQQYAVYAGIFTADRLITDDAGIDVRGPLIGLLSAHLHFPKQDLLVLACDMPLVEFALLQQLMNQQLRHPANASVFSYNGVLQPLCGIYSAAGLAAILQWQQSGQLVKHSLKYVLEKMQAAFIPLLPSQQQQFSNFNTPADLNGL
jgi:molybdenum cofactor guanylyltransferase